MSERPDWVFDHAVTRSNHWLFEALVAEVRRDVDRINELAPQIERMQETAKIEISNAGPHLNVWFEHSDHEGQRFGAVQISVRNTGGQKVYVYRERGLVLEGDVRWADGRCFVVRTVDGVEERLRPWEVSRLALEPVFFPEGRS